MMRTERNEAAPTPQSSCTFFFSNNFLSCLMVVEGFHKKGTRGMFVVANGKGDGASSGGVAANDVGSV